MSVPPRVISKPQILKLYRNILREHKRKLPYEMREIGDSFVKHEFKLHKTAKATFVPKFVNSWENYLLKIREQEDNIGENISPERLSVDQQIKLEELKLAIENQDKKEQ